MFYLRRDPLWGGEEKGRFLSYRVTMDRRLGNPRIGHVTLPLFVRKTFSRHFCKRIRKEPWLVGKRGNENYFIGWGLGGINYLYSNERNMSSALKARGGKVKIRKFPAEHQCGEKGGCMVSFVSMAIRLDFTPFCWYRGPLEGNM